jgi:signal transduction histidine kinase
MKRRKKESISKLGLRGWMTMECIVIVIGSIMIYELIDFVVNVIVNKNMDYEPVSGVGMFLPMSLLVYSITAAFSTTLYHYISELTDGIAKIAKGEFHEKLDENSGGPLKDVYHNFNIMCDELRSIDSLRNDFVNEFSHEFKTPLASINGFSNLLLEGNCTQEQVTQYLTIIAKESERLVSLTQSQLLLSKLDSQKIVIDKSKYFLDEQIRHCMIMLASEWERKNHEISIELPELSYYGNQDIMQHVWIKYTPDHGEIIITCKVKSTTIEISITDTGIGMTEEQSNLIFNKYYRVENSTSIKGLGLGLPIVKRILELSNGKLLVSSQPGEGSTFTVILPVEEEAIRKHHKSRTETKQG